MSRMILCALGKRWMKHSTEEGMSTRVRRRQGLGLEEVEAIHRDLLEALAPIARKHCVKVSTLVKLARTCGSALA